jgi:hypothetical protein
MSAFPLPSSPDLSAHAKPIKGCVLQEAMINVEEYIMMEYEGDKGYTTSRRKSVSTGDRVRDLEAKMRGYEEGQEWRFNKRDEWRIVGQRASAF